jgi:hypothetical protein
MIAKISKKDWYDTLEAELEASGEDYDTAHEVVYRHFKRLHGGAELDLPHDPKREAEIKNWLSECDE